MGVRGVLLLAILTLFIIGDKASAENWVRGYEDFSVDLDSLRQDSNGNQLFSMKWAPPAMGGFAHTIWVAFHCASQRVYYYENNTWVEQYHSDEFRAGFTRLLCRR